MFVWILFFSLTGLNLFRQSIDTWPIFGERDARVHLFFSPSCPHCQDAVHVYSGKLDAAFYPVMEGPEDFAAILAMEDALNAGQSMQEALENALRSEDAVQAPPLHTLLLRAKLLFNRAHVLRSGSAGVPYLEYRGLPKSVQKERERQKKAAQKSRRLPTEDAQIPEEKTKSADETHHTGSYQEHPTEDFLAPTADPQCHAQTCN